MTRWSVRFVNDRPIAVAYTVGKRIVLGEFHNTDVVTNHTQNAEALLQLSDDKRIRVDWNGRGASGFSINHEHLENNKWELVHYRPMTITGAI